MVAVIEPLTVGKGSHMRPETKQARREIDGIIQYSRKRPISREPSQVRPDPPIERLTVLKNLS
jgi:hypothetical protein